MTNHPSACERKDGRPTTMPTIHRTAPESGHLIEDAVVLYLVRDHERWAIDPSTIDGDPLESAS